MIIFAKVIWLHLLLLVMKGNAQDYILEGTEDLVDTTVVSRLIAFGTDWRGPAGSTVRIAFNLNRVVVDQIGERTETFSFTPEGSSTPIEVLFDNFPLNSVPPFVFPLHPDISALVCGAITKKQGQENEIIITSGTPSCNGQYTYIVTIEDTVDTATSTIQFSGGTPPNFLELNQVTSTSTDTFYGLLGTTFQTTIDRTQTVRINATDLVGEPRGSIQWFLTAAGSTGRIPLPGSLTGITIETPQTGTSILQIGGINAAHLGEYTAVATNSEGTDTASAFITEGVAPFIIRGSGQSGNSNFRVGANRAITLGNTVRIRAEDQQSNPTAATTWSYSRNALGPFALISDGGAYSISETSTGNTGIDSTLTITNTQEAQLGYYRAVAANAFGTSISTTSLVGRSPAIRRGSGVISEGGTADIGFSFTGAIGSTVTIIADDMNGFPQSNYRWQRIASNAPITNIASGGRFSIVESTANGRLRSTLTITGVRREELGTYRATASNGLPPDDIVDSLVGIASSCRSGTTVITVSNGGTYESAGYFDTTNANSFALQAADTSGVPPGTVSWTYSRTLSGGRSTPDTRFTSITGNTLNFFNLEDSTLGYYFAQITNDFGSAECANLVGSRLGFATGSGQVGQDSSVQIGSSVAITARFVRGFPSGGTITWGDPNDNTITSATPGYTISDSSDRSTLTILSASESNSGRYTASSSNLFGTVSESSNIAITTNIIAPTIDKGSPTTINTDNDGNIGELFKASVGNAITIYANDVAGVEESVIRWYRIPPGGTNFVEITSDSTFIIRSDANAQGFTESSLSFIVGSNTFGTYRAEASNDAGSDASISVVGQAPRIVGSFTTIGIDAGESRTVNVGGQVNIEEGGTINLVVTDIDGQPDRTFFWFYRNTVDGPFEPLPAFSNIGRLVNGNVGTLVINSLFGAQHGEYRVQATNEFGESTNVTTTVGGPPIIRVLTGVETDGSGEIGQDIQIPDSNRLRITACIIGGFPPANVFQFREEDTNLISVQQPPPNDNCYVYEEGEFEITCETTISARASNNEFGFGNEPMSRITFPAPRIIRGNARCNQGSTQSSIQIGDQLCLYNVNSFDITCSVERADIPEFSFQWQYQGTDIGNTSGQYTINRASAMSSRLTVLNAGINEVGRYTCRVTSTCGETDAVNTDANHYSYRYFCNDNEALICAQSINGGPETTVFSSICEQFGLERPVCARCNWETSQWSICSDQTCHRGRRTRTVQCICDGEDGEDIDCSRRSPRPTSLDQCGPRVRCNRPFEWRAYRFGACSTTCGVAYRQRRVECVSSLTGNMVSDEECVTLFKPRTMNRCLTRPCSDCVDQLPTEVCRGAVTAMGGDCRKYFLKFDCCATCATFA